MLSAQINAMNMLNLTNAIVPITRFNKGEAGKIIDEVKNEGPRIIVKNNVPECILMSPQDYRQMMEEYENALLIAESQKRLSEKTDYIAQDTIMKKYGLSESDLDEIEVNLE